MCGPFEGRPQFTILGSEKCAACLFVFFWVRCPACLSVCLSVYLSYFLISILLTNVFISICRGRRKLALVISFKGYCRCLSSLPFFLQDTCLDDLTGLSLQQSSFQCSPSWVVGPVGSDRVRGGRVGKVKLRGSSLRISLLHTCVDMYVCTRY